MAKKNTEILVGAFVLLGLLALIFVALKAANLGSVGGGNTYEVEARFDNIGGLKTRAPVRTAGVTVGRVTHIELDKKTFQGVVTMAIRTSYQYPKDSAAKILTSGLLGDQYVGMDPGGDDANLQEGDTVAQTQSAVVLENLIGQFIASKADVPPGDAPSAVATSAKPIGPAVAPAAAPATPALAASGARQ